MFRYYNPTYYYVLRLVPNKNITIIGARSSPLNAPRGVEREGNLLGTIHRFETAAWTAGRRNGSKSNFTHCLHWPRCAQACARGCTGRRGEGRRRRLYTKDPRSYQRKSITGALWRCIGQLPACSPPGIPLAIAFSRLLLYKESHRRRCK